MLARTSRTLTAALALFASACTDAPTTAPAARAPAERASLAAGDARPALVPNAVKYRDKGGKPATGRSGSARLEALALLAKNGTTTLTYSARHVTDGSIPGLITMTQTRVFDGDGKQKFINNFQSAEGIRDRRVEYQGLSRGDRLQLQANVKGIDPHRTDVVTVAETVKRLPDLRVQVTAPAEVRTNTPVNILATVYEHNGDMGANARCELYIRGTLADYASGVWVDAGDTVTCAFTTSFSAPGAYPVEVRLSASEPGDWEPADNVGTATILARGGSPGFTTVAYFQQTSDLDDLVFEEWWRNTATGEAGELIQRSFSYNVTQSAVLYGVMEARFTEPAEIKASMSTGTRVVHAAEWSQPVLEGLFSKCASRWFGSVFFGMCSGAGGADTTTTLHYTRMAGAVTYHSRGYFQTWDLVTGEEWEVYHWNYENASDNGIVPLGDDWSYDVRLTTPGGEHVLSRTVQLVRTTTWEFSQPYECSTEWHEIYENYSVWACSAYTARTELISGAAFGDGY
jgi:hypothetical protein